MSQLYIFGIILFTQLNFVDCDAQGIAFEYNLTWPQVLEKAKSENKYIFIDCYATWCTPCKLMDRHVYVEREVGGYINEHFISVKVQMDTGKNDSELIKRWYSVAKTFEKQFDVSQLPTYLFFSPDGAIVHRNSGAMGESSFLALATEALDPEKQFYSIVKKYYTGYMTYREMPRLALEANENGSSDIANEVSMRYIKEYLNVICRDSLFACMNSQFMRSTLFINNVSSKDNVFSEICANRFTMDSITKYKGYADFLVNLLIKKEIIDSALKDTSSLEGGSPSWNKLARFIDIKYGKEIAQKSIIEAKLLWYTEHKNWTCVVHYNVQKIEKYGLDTSGFGWVYMNNIFYDIVFEHATDKRTLLKAAKWMWLINKLHPDDAQDIDTYANLLYKAGKAKEAIIWEKRAAILDEEEAKRRNSNVDRTYMETLRKMKSNEPTWLPD